MEKSILTKINALLEEAFRVRVFDLTTSIKLSQEALQLSKEIGDKPSIGKSFNLLALFFMIQGKQKLSLQYAEEAIDFFKELDDELGIANAKYVIASIYYKSDNFHLGLVNLIDCLVIFRKHNDYSNQAKTLKSLGAIYEYFGDQKKAIESYEDSIDMAILAKDSNLESNVYNPLSGIYLNQKKFNKAIALIEKSIKMKTDSGDIRGLAFSVYGRAKIFLIQKKYKEAEIDFKESIKVHQQMGEQLGLGMSYYKLAVLYFECNRIAEAKEVAKAAIVLSFEYNIAIIKFKCYYLLYEINRSEEKIEEALKHLELYLKVREGVINTQTFKIIENYELITKMNSLELEAQLQKEKTEILVKTNRVEQVAKVKQEFLSTMSHEIRTPLNAVITIANLLEDKIKEEGKELLESLNFASANLLLIINDILDFSKLESGNAKLDNRAVHFVGLLKNIRNTYQGLAKEKNLELKLTMQDSIAESYQLDSTKLSQILANLISNAIKYTNYGEVNLNVFKIETDNGVDLIRFCVEDTGVGIPKIYLNDIFDSFSQPKSITTRTQGGTGLGLAIVKQLVHLFKSEIYVTSEEGVGSNFCFDLHLQKATLELRKVENVSTLLAGKIVLIADDNLINSMVAKKLISKWGLLSDHAINGEVAFQMAKVKKYDFILMDIHMPIMDGFEAAEKIRQLNELNCTTPIFALTADITAESQEEFSANFQGFLRKPIEIENLRDALLATL